MHAASGDGERGCPSPRWRWVAVLLGVGGVLVGIAAGPAILFIDHTVTAVHMSTAQDAVGVTAIAVFLGAVGGGLTAAVRLWRRPAFTVEGQGIRVWNRRSLLVPWPMIAGMTTFQPPTGGLRLGLALATGDVVPILFGPEVVPVPSAGSQRRAEAAARQMIETALRRSTAGGPLASLPGSGQAVPHSHGRKSARARPGLVRRDLPGAPVAVLPWQRGPRRWFILPVAALPVVLVRLAAAQSGHAFDPAQYGIAVAAIIGGLAVIAAALWLRFSRRLAVGDGWLAWQYRLHRGWRVLELSQVISVARGYGPGGQALVVKRADGRGIVLTPAELRRGAGAAVAAALAGSPAITAEARGLLAGAGAVLPTAVATEPAVGLPPAGIVGLLSDPHQPESGIPVPMRTSARYRASFGWVAVLGGVGFQVMFMVLAIAIPASRHEFAADFANRLILAVVGTFFALFCYVLGRCRVTAGPSALVIDQPLTRYHLPWADVDDVAVGSDGGMRVLSRSLGAISVAAFGGSLLGALTGGIRAQRARDAINEVRAAALQAPGPSGRASKSIGIDWLIPGLAACLLIVAALIGALLH